MIVDAHSVPSGTAIETEVCIIGGGAAGITLALKFVDAPFRVALLESGGMDYEPDTQDLYQGLSIGQPFQDLKASRLRYFGGTTNHWGGWCLPLDEIDFETRDGFPYHGWPFPKSTLDPWYRRGQEICQLGPYDYAPASWGMAASAVPPPFSGPDFEIKLLQESWTRFGPVYAPALQRAPRVTVYLHANAFHMDGGETDTEVKELSVKTLTGVHLTVRARIYILAAGGIENARILLASGKEGGGGLGNAHDLVGRFLMVHLAYGGGTIVPSDPHMNFDFQTRDKYLYSEGRRLVIPLFGLSADVMRRRQLSNIMMMWTYHFAPVRDALDSMGRLAGGEGLRGSLTDLSTVFGNLDRLAQFGLRKALYGEGIAIEALELGCASEQLPNPESRVSLGLERDRLGMREVVVDWQLMAQDKTNAITTVKLLGAEIGRVGFGRLRAALSEDEAWPEGFYGNEHHMGTTRMHHDPALGVVDENCRVHTIANLYVAGSSVFPTAGASNPTLTIVALALRLADHLKSQLA
jgi:choline dehydrogenase-like flavoprotein